MRVESHTTKIVMTALMMGIVMVAVMFIRVPIPFTQGYVHLGDAMIFLSVLILGWKYGAVAGAVGATLADILGGFAMWAPWTFVIKALMAVIMGLFIFAAQKKEKPAMIASVPLVEIIGMAISGVVMVFGYYVAEGFMYGNWVAPMLGVPWNIGQFVVGMVIATALAAALYKTPARRYFYFN